MRLFHSVSQICQAWTLNSAVWPVLSPTHPHASCLIVTGLYPERKEWLTMVDWQVYSALPSSSWLWYSLFLHDSLDPLWQPKVFKYLTMLQVFYSWLESVWLGMEPKPQWATQSTKGQMVTSVRAWKGSCIWLCAYVYSQLISHSTRPISLIFLMLIHDCVLKDLSRLYSFTIFETPIFLSTLRFHTDIDCRLLTPHNQLKGARSGQLLHFSTSHGWWTSALYECTRLVTK